MTYFGIDNMSKKIIKEDMTEEDAKKLIDINAFMGIYKMDERHKVEKCEYCKKDLLVKFYAVKFYKWSGIQLRCKACDGTVAWLMVDTEVAQGKGKVEKNGITGGLPKAKPVSFEKSMYG